MSVHKTARDGRTRYVVRYREGGSEGTHRSRSFERRADADAFDASRRRRAQLGAHAPVEPDRMRLGDWLETWLEDGRTRWAKSTTIPRASILDKWVAPFIGDVRLSDLGRRRLIEYRREITAKGCTTKQVNATMRVLSAALTSAVHEELIPSNPCHGLERLPTTKPATRALSADEAERIRAALPTQQDRVAWGLMFAAGLRPEEVWPLRWRDIDLDACRVMIDRTFVAGELRERTKTGPGRDVDIVRPLATDLRQLYAEQGSPSREALVVPSDGGTCIDLCNWRNRVWNPVRRVVGPSWATPYSGRRTYISLRIFAGDSPLMVAASVGHTNGETLWRHYAREFERARTALPVPLGQAIETARKALHAPADVLPVFYEKAEGPSRGHLRLVV